MKSSHLHQAESAVIKLENIFSSNRLKLKKFPA